MQRGFTLIELSIVLVIIGLIIGGILLGRDLIAASEVRAQIAQIEKYNTAVNTFKNKYGGIPGDINIPLANQFGFYTDSTCTGIMGERDGNGLIDGWMSAPSSHQASFETGMFWVDLSTAGLIDGEFPNNGAPNITCGVSITALTLTPGVSYIGDYLPAARIGRGNFIYVYETNGANWYGLSAVSNVATTEVMNSAPNLPVIQAYNIDKKVDDGLPTSGSVLAAYMGNGSSTPYQLPNAQNTDSATSCYNTTNNVYSLSASANQGAGLNCALSFKFQ